MNDERREERESMRKGEVDIEKKKLIINVD